MIIYLNYTFSVPDKRLYTLYKGITVTPRVVQASSVSSHGQATFTRGASCLMLRTVPPLHVCCSHVPWHHLGGAKGHCSRCAFGTEPAHDSAPVAKCSRDAPHGPPSTMSLSAPVAWRFLAPSHLRRRGSPLHTFGAEGQRHSGSTRGVVPAKQRSQNSSSISVIVKSSKHASSKQPEVARGPKPTIWPDVA
jgi:hypothetical protein